MNSAHQVNYENTKMFFLFVFHILLVFHEAGPPRFQNHNHLGLETSRLILLNANQGSQIA